MTNFEWIQNMSVDDFAVFLTTLIHERDVELHRKLAEKSGLEISLFELSPDIQASIHKNWLESEVEDG